MSPTIWTAQHIHYPEVAALFLFDSRPAQADIAAASASRFPLLNASFPEDWMIEELPLHQLTPSKP